jgi:hypothetical protein
MNVVFGAQRRNGRVRCIQYRWDHETNSYGKHGRVTIICGASTHLWRELQKVPDSLLTPDNNALQAP